MRKGAKHSLEARAKMCALHKGKKPSTFTFKGRKHTPESKAKLSVALKGRFKGRKLSPETRAKISAALKSIDNRGFRGRKHSPETRAKMSASRKIAMNRPEVKAKLSAARKGKKLSPETRAKISAANKGKKPPSWKGGVSSYWHKKAWECHGKDQCEVCSLSEKEHKRRTKKRLHMHCKSGDYKDQTASNWVSLCLGCHHKFDGGWNKHHRTTFPRALCVRV